MPSAYWICCAVTAVSAFISLAYSIAELRRAHWAGGGKNADAQTASLYAFSRSLALALAATIAPISGSIAFVGAAAMTMILVQAIDAGVGAVTRNLDKTIGPAVIAGVNFAALIWMLY